MIKRGYPSNSRKISIKCCFTIILFLCYNYVTITYALFDSDFQAFMNSHKPWLGVWKL